MSEVAQHALVNHASFSALPFELIEALNQTYFLHLLVTDPKKVIPPGKSLLSMMTHANFKVSDGEPKDINHARILDRVKEVAYRAFWNEALEQLSSPLPSVQIPRLTQFYLDLHEALAPLFPPKHLILLTLSSPLPPTPSPLRSTTCLLVEILTALRQRCAPVRYQAIDELLEALSHPPASHKPLYDTPDMAYTSQFAEFVIENIKAILSLAEDMKTDLNTFVLGAMTESQLQGVLLNEVKIRERELVLRAWGGKDVIRGRWRSWISETASPSSDGLHNKKWISRLFRALESDQPIHCMLQSPLATPSSVLNGQPNIEPDNQPPTPKSNELPPQLFFSTPSLLYIQNHLQAIVIAAALRFLTRLSAHPPSSNIGSLPANDFMSRIWALLEAEIDDEAGRGDGDDGGRDAAGHTKLINLEDEVVRARQRASAPSDALSSLDPEEEKQLRAAVERTLRSTDPVFLLLKKRLISALEKRVILLSSSDDIVNPNAKSTQVIPARMQTGNNLIEERAGKRPRLDLAESILPTGGTSGLSQRAGVSMGGTIPGFEDGVLQGGIEDVLQKIIGSVSWVEGVWGDLV